MDSKCKHIFCCRVLFTLFLVFDISCCLLNAQPFTSKTFSAANGLTHNYVQSVAQDKTGFLWIATWDGISRFDGYEFRNYHHRPNDSTTFSFFAADKILVDSLNDVWVLCTLKPLYRYNKVNDNFVSFNLVANNAFSDITMDNKANIWLIDRERLFHYFPSENKIRQLRIVSDNNQNSFCFENKPQIVFDNQNKMWFFDYYSTGFKVFTGSYLNDSVVIVQPLNEILFPESKSFHLKQSHGNFDVFTTNSNETWLFSKFGLFLFDKENNTFILKHNIHNVSKLNGKPYFSWIDENSGINIINSETGKHFLIPNPPGLYYETMFQDKNGNIWAGTVSETRTNIGLVMFRPTPENIHHYLTGFNENGDINLVFPVIKDKYGNIWAGTRSLNYIYKIKPGLTVEKIKFLPWLSGNNHPKVRSMTQDSTGIWLGCTNNYILFYDYKTGKFQVLNSSPVTFNNVSCTLDIHNILKRGEMLVISGGQGVYSYSLKNGKFKLEYSTETTGTLFSLTEDGNGGFWLGSYNSTIIHLDSLFNEIGIYKIGDENDHVEHVCLGDNNDLWIALMGGGLGHLEPATGKTEIYTTADGLSNNTLYSILKDNHGNLWISTNKGISQFNPKTKTFRNIGEEEGLHIDEFNSDAFFQGNDGIMFFGGVGGMIGFYPDSLNKTRDYSLNMPLVITGFKVSGTERRFRKAIFETDTVKLEKGENNMQLTFAMLDFNYADKTRYRYRIAEEDEQWTETDYRNRNVNYTNLSPGTYHFEIQCTNLDGEWDSSRKLVIIIPFFYYQTIWFRFAVVILFLLLIVFITGLIIRQIRLKAIQKQNDLKLESLRSQMNPHFIFNALNSINYFISKSDKVSANSYISDFSRLIRSFLNNLSTDFIPFENELESIKDYLKLEHLRFGDKFNYVFNIEIENPRNISVFPGLVQPFIENAVWHGIRGIDDGAGLIRISFRTADSLKLVCTVEDNGIGRKQAEFYKNRMPGKKSQGISIVEDRLKIISEIRKVKYKLTIEDIEPGKENTGTRVIIDIPVQPL